MAKVNDLVEISSTGPPIIAKVVGRYVGSRGADDIRLILRLPDATGTVVLHESEVTVVEATSDRSSRDDFVDWTPEQHLDAATALLEGGYPMAGQDAGVATARILRAQWHAIQAQVKQMRAAQHPAPPSPTMMFRVLRAELSRQRAKQRRLHGLQQRWQQRVERFNRVHARARYLRRIV